MYSARRRIIFQDCSFLSVAVILSAILYVGRMGFYYDDWIHLAHMELADDHSIIALLMEWMTQSPIRPVEGIYHVLAYKIFGLDPLGYHIFCIVIFIANAVLFYLCLLQLRQPRLISVSVPLVYIMLPHYSTDRFWSSTFFTPLSMVFYFASLYTDLRALDAHGSRFAIWKTGSLGALLGGTLAYETTLGLFLINPFLIWYVAKTFRTSSVGNHKNRRSIDLIILYGSNAVAIAAVVLFKVAFRNRIETPPSFLRYFRDLAYHMIRPRIGEQDWGFNISQFIGVDLVDRGVKLPLLAVEALLRRYISKPEAAITVALGILVLFYVYRIASHEPESWLCRRDWHRMMAAGLAAGLAGYAIFFLVWPIQFTFAGVQNRVSMSAAPGLALMFVGLMGFALSKRCANSLRPAGFASLVALFAASGCLVNYAIASFWIAASERQPAIIEAIRNHFPTFPKGRTLILDGACPNVGPGIVFQSNWDLAGALKLLYRDRELRADVVTPSLKVARDGIETLEASVLNTYPYGPGLLIYNVRRNTHAHILDMKAAEDYFANPENGLPSDCHPLDEGVGIPIF
jgi:hypothetical protein